MPPKEWLKLAPKPRPLTDGKIWNVFLSYRSVNRGWVLNLYDVLTELGHKVFLDQYVLKPGDILINKLQEALESSQAGVLVWSDANKDSKWVNEEYVTLQGRAIAEDFIFVSVKIDNSKLPLFAANRIYVDFSSYPDGPNGGDLLRLVHAIVGEALKQEDIRFANEQDEAAMVATALVNTAIRHRRPERLIELFRTGGLVWETTASLGCKVAEGLTRLAEYDKAIMVLEELEKNFPRSIRPRQLKGLALARRASDKTLARSKKENDKDLEDAQEILGVLIEQNYMDSETMGIYARTWMDRYNNYGDIRDLRESAKYYSTAFDKQPTDYYPGINAAAKNVFLKDWAKAAEYADKVEKLVGLTVAEGDYWKTATVAEVQLIKRNYKAAAELYQKAVDIAPHEDGSIRSTAGQAELLMEQLQPPEAEKLLILNVFKDYMTPRT